MSIKKEMLFSGTQELSRPSLLTIEEEIEAAAQRDPWSEGNSERATMHANVEIGLGEGRCTREVEVIWWPDVYDTTNNGHFTLRFYLEKVSV